MKLISTTYLQKKNSWRVRYRDPAGRTREKYFPKEEEARAWLPRDDEGIGTLTESERIQVAEFLKSIRETPSVTLGHALEKYKDDMQRRNLRSSYVRNCEYVLDLFVLDRESWSVEAITPESVVTYCLDVSGHENQDTVRRRIISFLNWCREKKWTEIDTKQIRWRRARTDRKRVGFYTPEQVEAILRAAPDKLKFPLALAFFTGIRPKGELMRLTYDQIDARTRTIKIDEATSKTRTFRTLYNLPDNLWAWYAKAKPKRGKVVPMNYRNFRANIAKVQPVPWPQDCTRHTFCSCAFHLGLEWAMDISGHRDSRIFMTRYKGQIHPDEAQKLWAIHP